MARLMREDVIQIAIEVYKILLEEELEVTATVHAEQFKLVQWIEELAKRGELDITGLADEAEKRAYALAVKKAEEAVFFVEGNLLTVKKEISRKQNELACSVGLSIYDQKKRVLAQLYEQETALTKRLEDERKRLTSLKLEKTGLSLLP